MGVTGAPGDATTTPKKTPGRAIVAMPSQRETQREMIAKHGTPDQFEAAVWRAHADGFVTTAEADEAIRKYKSDYNGAPA